MNQIELDILEVLERNDGKCLDNESERKSIARAIDKMLSVRYAIERL